MASSIAVLGLAVAQVLGLAAAQASVHFENPLHETGRVCCRAFTAQCLACSRGVSVEKFCSDLLYQIVRGCPPPTPHVPVLPEDTTICNRFRVGQEVTAISRGPGRIFCESSMKSTVIGICQEPFTGHDNYQTCKHGRQAGCGPKALWFVRCEELAERRPISPPMPVPAPEPAPSGLCGCGWSARDGCVVSSKQLVAALSDDRLVERGCRENENIPECHVRKQQVARAKRLMKCVGRSPYECRAMAPVCQWAAQDSGECGIDEHQLMTELVGDHRVVDLISRRKNCSKHTEATCTANAGCSWVLGSTQAMCDVDTSILILMMFREPDLVMDLQRSGEEAMCRAKWESLSPRSCPEPMCQMSGGICQYNPKSPGPHSLNSMLETLCMQSWRSKRTCPHPCVKLPSSVGGTCSGRAGMMFLRSRSSHDEYVVTVMAVLMSSLWPYQQQCLAAAHPDTCQRHGPLCGERESPALIDLDTAHAAAFGPGLKGALQRASSAIAAGRAGQFLEDHLENTAEDLQNLTKMALDSLSSLFKNTEAPTTTVFTTPEPSMIVDGEPELVPEGTLEEIHGPLDLEGTMNLWVVAGVAALVAAICSGVALGVLCHARLVRTQAREPLLAGSRAEAAAAPVNEMEPMSGNA